MSIENSIGASWAPAAVPRASCGRTPRGSSDPTLSDTCDRTGSAISRHRAGKANRIQRRRRRRTAALVDRRSEADRLRFLAEVASLRFELAVLRLSTRANKALHHSNFQPRVPAGSADGGQFADGGGQWIQIAQRGGDKLPGISGPGGGRRGHHCMPQGVFKKYALSDEALAVFDKARSGLLET